MHNDNKINVAFEWLKGFKFEMKNIKSRFIHVCVGVAIIFCSLAILLHEIAPNGFVH